MNNYFVATAISEKDERMKFIVRADNIKDAESKLRQEIMIGQRDELIVKEATINDIMSLFKFTNDVAQV